MILLPILGRELRGRARSRATYWTRFAVGLAGVLICTQSLVSETFGKPALMGRLVFGGLLSAAFLVSCSACLLTADAISAERREGTLALLFLTRVRVTDVLLGKVGSIGITGLGALAAFMPVLMIPLLAGGVTGGEVARNALALIDLLFFSLLAGLCASAAQSERFRAVRSAVLLVLLGIVVPLFPFVVWGGTPAGYLGAPSPLMLVIAAGEKFYSGRPAYFWVSLVAVQIVAWCFLAWAGFRLRRAVADEGGVVIPRPAQPPKEAARGVGLGVWQPEKNESSPVEWLVYRQYGVGAGIWGAALLALAYNGWVPLARPPFSGPGGAFSWAFAWPLGVVGGLIGGAMVAWVASRFFAGVRRTGDLELLMTTPVGAQSIVSEQWRVLKRLFTWPVLAMQAPMLPQLLSALTPPAAMSIPTHSHDTLYKLLSVANTFLGANALCWLGLWFGLKARTQAGAIVWAVALAKGVPSLVSLFGLVFGAAMLGSLSRAGSISYAAIAWLPETTNLLYLLWLIWLARRRLLGDLADGEPLPFDFRQSVQETASALGRLRTRATSNDLLANRRA
jgi:hypothetical protein